MIRSPLLARVPWLAHGLSTRADGSVGAADGSAALERRRELARRVGGRGERLVSAVQVHGVDVGVVGSADVGRPACPRDGLQRDGLATSTPGLTLMVQGADCPLILLAGTGAASIAVVHSGWRGSVGRIAAAGVDALASLGASPDGILAAVFPGIGPCCFEVGPEVVAAFADSFGSDSEAWCEPSARDGHAHLDLAAAITTTLVEAGLGAARIDVVPGCTACGEQLYSHRASGGSAGRHGLFALIRE